MRVCWLRTKSASPKNFQVINRVACEELEAWFFGDPKAIVTAYPKAPATFARRAAYREPDNITGGTAEALGRVLKRAGYYDDLPKVEVAKRVAAKMDPDRNSSPSFCCFVDAIRLATKPDLKTRSDEDERDV